MAQERAYLKVSKHNIKERLENGLLRDKEICVKCAKYQISNDFNPKLIQFRKSVSKSVQVMKMCKTTIF